jgi:hypothetical protein
MTGCIVHAISAGSDSNLILCRIGFDFMWISLHCCHSRRSQLMVTVNVTSSMLLLQAAYTYS